MKIILLGPPGCGKGTQAQMITEQCKMPHISTGDILRDNLKNKTPLGLEAQQYMNKGALVPDGLIHKIILDRLKQKDCQNSFLLDGFPRNIDQAKFLQSQQIQIDLVIEINVPDSLIIRRIVGRRSHPDSGRIYHIEFSPPKIAGKDDLTGEDLIHRQDDQEQTVKSRLQVYHQQTSPLIAFYQSEQKLKKVDGTDEPLVVFNAIQSLLDCLN